MEPVALLGREMHAAHSGHTHSAVVAPRACVVGWTPDATSDGESHPHVKWGASLGGHALLS